MAVALRTDIIITPEWQEALCGTSTNHASSTT